MTIKICKKAWLCDYCNVREAVHKFKNGRWCCEEDVHRCPGFKERLSKKLAEKYKDSKIGKLRQDLKDGKLKCKYCGRRARFLLNNTTMPCCQPKARLCPNKKYWFGRIIKNTYRKNPELKENLREIMLELQNRPEIKEKKSETMKILHNADCDKCKDFQKHYTDGKTKCKEKRREKFIKLCLEFDIEESILENLTTDQIKRKWQYAKLKRKKELKKQEELVKIDTMSTETMMKEFDLTEEEVNALTEEAAIQSSYLVYVKNGELYERKE